MGKSGAAAVFGPQKGATSNMVNELEKGLKNWASIICSETGKRLELVEGGGAAGGIAIPLIAFYKAEIVPGANFVLNQLNFEENVKWADVIISGEGKIDSQTLNNKAPFAVAKIARKNKKPVFAIGGQVEKEASYIFDEVYSLTNSLISSEYAIKNVKQLLFDVSCELAKQQINEMNSEKLKRVEELIREEKALEARKIFNNIEQEETVQYYFVKGTLEQKFQKFGDAINAFSKVIELDSKNIEAKNNLHLIQNILNFWNPEMFNP